MLVYVPLYFILSLFSPTHIHPINKYTYNSLVTIFWMAYLALNQHEGIKIWIVRRNQNRSKRRHAIRTMHLVFMSKQSNMVTSEKINQLLNFNDSCARHRLMTLMLIELLNYNVYAINFSIIAPRHTQHTTYIIEWMGKYAKYLYIKYISIQKIERKYAIAIHHRSKFTFNQSLFILIKEFSRFTFFFYIFFFSTEAPIK